MKVMSPGRASRIPATPRISSVPSPSISPPRAAASSASVRTSIGGLAGSGFRAQIELLHDLGAQVEGAVGVDDRPARGIEHDLEPALTRQLLDHGADLVDDLPRRPVVLLGRTALRAPD